MFGRLAQSQFTPMFFYAQSQFMHQTDVPHVARSRLIWCYRQLAFVSVFLISVFLHPQLTYQFSDDSWAKSGQPLQPRPWWLNSVTWDILNLHCIAPSFGLVYTMDHEVRACMEDDILFMVRLPHSIIQIHNSVLWDWQYYGDVFIFRLNVGIFCIIMSVPHNIVMDLNNVMHGPSFWTTGLQSLSVSH
jgi:hypothetical protein